MKNKKNEKNKNINELLISPEKIKIILAKNKISKKDFAKKLDINQCTLSRYLNGSINPRKTTIKAMAMFLNVDLKEIILEEQILLNEKNNKLNQTNNEIIDKKTIEEDLFLNIKKNSEKDNSNITKEEVVEIYNNFIINEVIEDMERFKNGYLKLDTIQKQKMFAILNEVFDDIFVLSNN